ncbi:MAG: T9SS type A sorting domain-containing protein [Bacteroidales bacterium]|nr:T9SS type A sorting domain-containing protein [Bacteroidales bacterium]
MINLKYIFLISFLLFFATSEAQISGCTDPLATNFNALATQNDGSCVYGIVTLSPVSDLDLPQIMEETSGLILWNNWFWTFNDDSDSNLYAFDTLTINQFHTYPLSGTGNIDWEEISHDNDYIYIGDFGNNTNGNRTDLKILRIEKNSLLLQAPVIDTISFTYSTQTDFTPTGMNNTDFDCEAFIISSDSIYLFTKQWISNKTDLFVLPKTPGNHLAMYKATLDVQGMITGAVFKEAERLIALSGYTNYLQPFVYLLYDYNNTDFSSGNKRKIYLNLSMHQVEGITTRDGLTFFITNEKYVHTSNTILQKFHTLDLSAYLSNYLNNSATNDYFLDESKVLVYPNPAESHITLVKKNFSKEVQFKILNMQGRLIQKGILNNIETDIDIEHYDPGVYILIITGNQFQVERIIKI